MTKIIRSSTHILSDLNCGKHMSYTQFMIDCHEFMQQVLDDIWLNGYQDDNYVFDLKSNQYNLPALLKDKFKHINSPLSARCRKCLITQLSGMIRSSTEKQRKRLYVYNKSKAEGITKHKLRHLIKAIKQNIPQKPNISNVKFELDAICNDFKETGGKFYGHIRLKSIYKSRKEIKIPVKSHRHLLKMKSNGRQLGSILLSNDRIDLRWEHEIIVKSDGHKLGCDQGIKTLITTTDETGTTQSTPLTCAHGHSIESIMDKLVRKKKGSNAFKRAVAHRTNYINQMINDIDLTNISEVRFEEIININKGKNVSRKMRHWTNTDIRDKMKSKCEIEGVRFTLQSCTYRSQRCSCCGLVRKANRKGKIYSCKSCGFIDDADINASKNHLVDLPEIPYTLRKSRQNLGNGFIWSIDGFFDVNGGNLQFPLPEKK
jgi:transposase